ncbi:uncharacterized protein LOC125067493 [Vanessa atalanta]|uniref:uncharacterized protein LOC125067493 n=1 Tax=Vanessa atalanta TaxID=42275 RepID=UPI001FCD1B84|nr:uncharacterized protein LOC125067493 [Vanessa atalanta]
MATMIKEKSKDKRKSKDKHKLKKVFLPEVQLEEQEQSISNETIPNEILPETQTLTEITNFLDKSNIIEENKKVEVEQTLNVTAISTTDVNKDVETTENISIREIENAKEIVLPSAPLLEENVSIQTSYLQSEKLQENTKTKVTCLPLDEAIRLFGGKELAEVRAISEKEEAIVEAGPQSKPDHPLIDLLSTFRTSLIAVDRERNRLSCKYVEEEKSRATLWKVEKRTLNLSEKCACGTNVNLKANFDVAKLDRERLSAARLRLEALLQDVQDSYCHHQHTALQTHCDIDEVINETIQKPNEYIREALSLVFEALRFSDAAPVAYAEALQRWASVLSSVLLEEDNLSHLLFVLHNLFRQTRSVQWAGHVLSVRVPDMCAAARLLGVLELLLTRPLLESAHECTEDSEAWEELDDSGEGCAVGEGRLRERDLLALLRALPLRDLLARLALFGRQDMSEQSEQRWGDPSGGHGVLKASCGVRAALHVCVRARRSHAGYARLRAGLRALAAAALHALAALHAHSRSSYVNDLAEKIPAELEACFAAGLALLGEEAYKLPATLLSDDVVEEYCNTLIGGLHDKSVHIASLSVQVEALSCGLRTRIVAQAALSRPQDQDLARTVLDFLFQTGIHRKPSCKGLCDVTARELLPKLLAVHPHVHTLAFHMLADYNQVEADSSLLEPLSLKHWRPTSAEIVGVLDDWAIRCPQLLQHLLLNLDYTPHTGVALDSQLSAGSWVCEWAARRGAAPEWAWRALRALRVHRSLWRRPGCAPPAPAPPAAAPPSALHAALALLAGDWGHSVPLKMTSQQIAGASISDPPELAVVTVSSRIPEFWCDQPRLWFVQCEAILVPQKLSRFNLVVTKLGKEVIQQVSDILLKPPDVKKYDTLKERLLKVYEESEIRQFQKLLSEMELGDQKPSQLLRRMRDLAREKISDETLRIMWQGHLPPSVRGVLAVSEVRDLENLAAIADKVMETTRPLQFAEVQAKSSSSTNASTSSDTAFIIAELAKLSLKIRNIEKQRNRREKYRGHRSRSRSASRIRNTMQNNPEWLCFYQISSQSKKMYRAVCLENELTAVDLLEDKIKLVRVLKEFNELDYVWVTLAIVEGFHFAEDPGAGVPRYFVDDLHSKLLPRACGPGAEALLQLAQTRPLDALHCAGFIMRVMAQSPESISFTPKFTEIFATILNFGPSLVQRALGQRAESGADLLQKLVLDQLQDPDTDEAERSALLRAWLHALWVPALAPRARALLDRALRRSRAWCTLDAHVDALLQEESGKEYVGDAVRHAGAAPLLCECALRHAHARELATHMYARLLEQLARQQAAAQKIHVDNALKQIGSSLCDDELSIHRCAYAVLSVPMQHPGHVLLWRLLLHMWLHRRSASAPPVGPLFFSGIVKSRTLAQLKKRLQETAAYHRNQVDILKTGDSATSSAAAPSKVRKSTPPLDNDLFQTLSVVTDLIGKSESEQDLTVSEGDSNTETKSESETKGYDVLNLICYHTAAEKMVREYLMWLDEGENVRAYPHHADIARYISEQALDAAWRASLDDAPPPAPPPAPPSPPRPPTHFERAVAAVMSIEDGSQKRYNMHTSHISISDSVLEDPFLLIEMVEKYIEELKKLTEQWQSDCFRVALLDSQLWDLVEGLRVRRPLPPVRAACPQDCKPLVVHIPEDEWCISSGAEQAIHENRRSARAAVRRLARPRPHAARVASLLHSVGRYTPTFLCRRMWSAQTGARAAQLAWGAAPRAEPYPPARDALAALVAAVAQRWLNHDSVLTSELLARWSTGSGLQQQLCGVLVTPARMPANHWPRLYGTVLALPLPPHAIFSYLSKFDITHWADVTDTSSRNEVLESIVKAATRIGPEPKEQDLVLVEILGVHSAALVREHELCEHVLRCARACAAGSLPPPYCAHLSALASRARDLHLEQTGRLLHDLGVIWWEARSSPRNNSSLYAEYAPHFANTLYSLLKEFVAAAVRCTYTPERVAYCSWPVLQTSWCPWVAPQSSLSQIDRQCEVLERFVETIRMVMDDCPGSAEAMLRYTWEWAAQCALSEPRASCALLAQLALLPWQTLWLRADCVPLALQLCGIADEEARRWFGEFVRHASAECWLRGAADEQVSPALAALLALFTAARPLVPPETLEGAYQLPWHRLPLPALDAALERYFADHHNPGLPYHELPHFRVLLCAAQLVRGEGGAGGAGGAAGAAGEARALCVSQWARALTSPALRAHVAAHTRCLLHVLTDLAPSVEEAELTELLSRALVVLCVQPADAIALPVWEQWACACDAHVRRACASAVASLTAIDSFATLGDTLVKAIMSEKEPAEWAAVWSRWAGRCAWGAAALLARARPHAAYAALLARAHPPDELRDVLRTLLAADIDFVQNEVIISVWICVASRVSCGAAEGDECAGAARALLSGWAERRRTLLQLVTLHPAGNCPTAQQQLLCRLALHVRCPSDATWRALESARSACGAPAAPAARAPPSPRAVPQLAAALYPAREHYFAHELRLAPGQ